MTSPIPAPRDPRLDDVDGEETRPGPGLRWEGDGALARRRAPLWGSLSGAAAADTPPISAPRDDEPAPISPLTQRRPTIDGAGLASPARRTSAWLIDHLVKTLIFVVILDLADVDVAEAAWGDPQLVAAWALLSAGYSFIFGIHGVTPAAYLLKVRIAAVDGGEPGAGRSIVRAAANAVNEAFLFVGSLWIFFDHRRQSLQDKAAGTVVVDVPRSEGRS